MERKHQQQLKESIDSVFLKENIYSLMGVPGNFDRNNKEHMDLLRTNYRNLSMALHPDTQSTRQASEDIKKTTEEVAELRPKVEWTEVTGEDPKTKKLVTTLKPPRLNFLDPANHDAILRHHERKLQQIDLNPHNDNGVVGKLARHAARAAAESERANLARLGFSYSRKSIPGSRELAYHGAEVLKGPVMKKTANGEANINVPWEDLHPDHKREYTEAAKKHLEDAIRHSQIENYKIYIASANQFLNDGGTTSELFVGPDAKIHAAAGVSTRLNFLRSDIDTVLNTAHGGDHWKPKEGKAISRGNGLQHVLDWEKEQKQHHGKITDALRSIYNPTSGGARQEPRQRSRRGATPNPPPPPNIKPTVMDRPPIRGNDTHSQYLHRALGNYETFLDPAHVGDASPASDMHSGQFKTTNLNLAHLYRTMFSNGPKYGFVVRSPFHSEGRVHGYNVDGGAPVENFSHQTHHLSMILDPVYAKRAIASAHSSHRNFIESFRQQHGRDATDQDLDAAIKAGTIRGVGFPAEEEDQKAVQRHIHALQMAAIHHPNVHANDLVAILQRRPSTHSDTESDPFGPRGRSIFAAAYSPKLQEDKNLQELQVAAISKLLHTRQSAGRRGNFTSSITGTRVQPTPASGQFITSSRQRAADLWDQHRKDILNKGTMMRNFLAAPVTPHHISMMYPNFISSMVPVGGFLRHEGTLPLISVPHQFGEELERLRKVEASERERHVLLGIHHPDALVRQIANAHTTNFPR